MTTILPISDLRNYGEVLAQVDTGKPVYLTRNGRGVYKIARIDTLNREEAKEQLLALIREAEEYNKGKPTYTTEEIAKKFGITL